MGILKPRERLIKGVIILYTVLFLFHPSARAQEVSELYEEKIKAGLVYNFLKYTTWPDDKKGRLEVCLFGDDAFDGYLSPLEGRTAQQSMISILRIRSAGEAKNCDLLFIHRSMEDSLPNLFAALENNHVLTVSDIKQFARKGGMVELATENEYINMYINRKAVDRAGLNIQSRLLKLAKIIPG